MDAAPTISTQGLSRRFGDFIAVDSIDLRVSPGQFFGFLGPNGAGKSTLMRTLATLQEADAGSVRLGTIDVLRDKDAVQIGRAHV